MRKHREVLDHESVFVLSSPISSPFTGEILAQKGSVVSYAMLAHMNSEHGIDRFMCSGQEHIIHS